jgi:hypothetical protein
MMSSASTPDFRANLRRQQRHPNSPSLSSPSSSYGLSVPSRATAAATQATQPATTTSTAVAPPDSRTLDPTFEPLERAGRAINDGIRKDDQFPQLDQLVQRISIATSVLMR